MQLYDVGMTGLYLSDTKALMALAVARNRTEVGSAAYLALSMAIVVV